MRQKIKLILITFFAVSLFMPACSPAEEPGLINKPFSVPEVHKKLAKMFSEAENILKNKRKKQNKEEEIITFIV